MKKILFAIHTLGGGGAEKVLVNTANYLVDKKGYDVTVFTIVDIGRNKLNLSPNVKYRTTIKLRERKRTNSERVALLDDNYNFIKRSLVFIYTIFWRFAPRKLLYSFFIKEKYDYEIAFLEGITAKFISGSRNKRSKKISWIHVDLEHEKKSKAFFRNKRDELNVYTSFDKIVSVSKVVKDSFDKQFPSLINKSSVIYNPVDQREIIEKSKLFKIERNETNINFISVGRLIEQKGYDRLINVVNQLVSNGLDNFEISILGTGPLYEELSGKIIELNLEKYIKFLGFKDNPYVYMANADYFVCSSRAEGYSTVVTEATILGIPTITTNCAGMNEIFRDDTLQFVVDNSTEGLYVGMKRILLTPELFHERRKYTENVARKFNLDSLVSVLEKEVLNEI